MIWFWSTILLVALALGHALLTNRPRPGEKHRFLPFVLLLFPIVIYFWFFLVPWYSADKTPPSWAGNDVAALYLLQIVATYVIFAIMEGRRWYALSIGVVAALIGLWATFLTLMGVTNDWL